jgi:hypothetical protein
MKKRLTVSALTMGLALAFAPLAAAHAEEVKLAFDTKATSARAAEGTVAGQVAGELSTRVRARRVSGNRTRVTMDWIVRAGGRSFTARLRGVINTRTRSGALTGRVTSGYLLGAEARAQGRLLGKNKRRFVGTLTLVGSTHVAPAPQPGGPSDGTIACEDFQIVCELPVDDGAGEPPVDDGAGDGGGSCHLAACEGEVAEEPTVSIPAAPAHPADAPVAVIE